jgi:hypothetical protein
MPRAVLDQVAILQSVAWPREVPVMPRSGHAGRFDASTFVRRGSALLLVLALGLAGCSRGGGPAAPRANSDPEQAAAAGVVLLEDVSQRQVFPPDNWWNLDVSSAPLDPGSSALIEFISGRTPQNPGATRIMHPDFGPPPYGIPYVGVGGDQPLVPVTFSPYGSQSDPGATGRPPGYPVPDEAGTLPNYIEGGVAGGGNSGDRHLIVIDRDRWLLFETWATRWNASLSRWEAGSGATFDLNSNARRPEGWTSADAAGLAIFPGLVRWDEVAAAESITHAFRVTVRATNGYVWPASHVAGNTSGAPPMGTRLRLKASVDISGYIPSVRKIFQAMKTYGLIVADNGTDLYVSGTMDPHWDNDVLNPAFHSLTADDFEVIELGWRPGTASVP